MKTILTQDPIVFSGERELERLSTQTLLTLSCEAPIFRELFEGRCGLRVLDVGSNNGEKTVRIFSDPAVEQVLGLEYNSSIALQAQAKRGDARFRFCHCDVEAEDFPRRLASLMAEEGREGFDIIYLSYVLSHLKSPETLLRLLRPLLKAGGVLVAIESNDAEASLEPADGRFREFLDMLAEDPYAGDRGVGGRLGALLTGCGFRAPALRCGAISAGPGEEEKKAMIFEMFFSYFPEDIALLRAESPEDARFACWEGWMREHYAALRRAVCAPGSRVSMGMSIITCTA